MLVDSDSDFSGLAGGDLRFWQSLGELSLQPFAGLHVLCVVSSQIQVDSYCRAVCMYVCVHGLQQVTISARAP